MAASMVTGRRGDRLVGVDPVPRSGTRAGHPSSFTASLANGTLWREVVPRLSGHFGTSYPTFLEAGHTGADEPGRGPDAPWGGPMVADLMERLDLRDVIPRRGNDMGGAICQIVVAEHPERIGSLVSPTATPTNPFSRCCSAPFTTPHVLRYESREPARARSTDARRPARLFKTVATAP
jgi:pimeloyl-ACP methyl ester carboxylesterase